MDKRNKKILEELKALLGAKVALNRISLFGSRARGDFSEESDMDVLIVVDELNPAVDKLVSECAWEVGFKHGVLIIPVTYSRSEWENGPERFSLLALAVAREGVSV